MKTSQRWTARGTAVLLAGAILTLAAATPLRAQTGSTMQDSISLYNVSLDRLSGGKSTEALEGFLRVVAALEALTDDDSRKLRAAAANNAGNILLLKGDAPGAERNYRIATTANPGSALAQSNLGTALLKQGRIEDSVTAYKAAVQIDPTNPEAVNNLGALLIEGGQDRLATEFLLGLLQVEKANERTLLLLGRAYHRLKMPEAEEKVLQALLRMGNNAPQARLRVANHHLSQGRAGKAADIARDISRHDPQDAEAKLVQARAARMSGDAATAETTGRELLRLQPENTRARNEFVLLLIDAGRLDEACAVAKEGPRATSGSAESWFTLGVCQERQGKAADAEASYAKAVAADPAHARALNNLGILAAKRGDKNAALAKFKAAVSADPFYDEALFNLGRAEILSKSDYQNGLRLVARAAAGSGPVAEKAKAFLADLETIARGGDPGWGGRVTP